VKHGGGSKTLIPTFAPFIIKTKPMKDIIYPLAKETINKEDVDALCEWLQGYPRLTKGPLTAEFEEDWAAYIGTSHAVFNNSGSSANLLMVAAALYAGKIPNKKIAVPSVGWVTTIAPAMQLGLTPIMVGADESTYGMDLDKLEELCSTDCPDAVIFVQVLGIPHYRERLLSLKERYGFILLEDACAALGASYADGSKVGTVGDMSSFSFYFGHQLSTIEGGMVNTNDSALNEMLLMLRSHGWAKDLGAKSYNALMSKHGIDDFHSPFAFFVPGFNLRPTDLQAFLGIRQVEKAEWAASRRNENHLRYGKNLKDVFQFQDWGKEIPVSISFGALAESGSARREIVSRLVANGVETRLFSAGNLGRHPFWTEKYGVFKDVISDRIHDCGFFLPNYPELTLEEVDSICDLIK
jgi:CDP-4-dehydro-6-deoxyglucose reductase, E1